MYSVLILVLITLQAENTCGLEYQNCLPPYPTSPYIIITHASVTDPVPVPGNITVAVDANITGLQDIDWDSLALEVTIKKHLYFHGYTTVPCFGNVGSCIYDKLCEFIESFYPNGTNCPVQLTSHGINCTCPLRLEELHLPPSEFHVPDVNPEWRWIFGTAPTGASSNMTTSLEFMDGSSTSSRNFHGHIGSKSKRPSSWLRELEAKDGDSGPSVTSSRIKEQVTKS